VQQPILVEEVMEVETESLMMISVQLQKKNNHKNQKKFLIMIIPGILQKRKSNPLNNVN
jgi:hypothetical protein